MYYRYQLLGKLPLENEPNLLSFDEKQNVILTYNHGENCTNGGTTKERKTEIIFNCDKNAIVSSFIFM